MVEPRLVGGAANLAAHAREQGRQVRFNVEARRRYLAFASSVEARWPGNFRELSASVTRMATLADAGRITEASVEDEIERLRYTWSGVGQVTDSLTDLLGEAAGRLELFDRAQLAAVIGVCRESASRSEAGRKLFAVSRQEKRQANDADRLRKYLARLGLDWVSVSGR